MLIEFAEQRNDTESWDDDDVVLKGFPSLSMCRPAGSGGDVQRPMGPQQLSDVRDCGPDLQCCGLLGNHEHGVETPQ